MTDPLMVFAPAVEQTPASNNEKQPADKALPPWEVLIVDDDQSVHDVTRLILRNFEFEGRSLQLTHCYSAVEARDVLQNQERFAVLLLDVVMESENAGLELVSYIRNTLNNPFLRIILRTGQPGQAPELSVIVDYDINDYREKSELTSPKLRTCLTAALRSYRDIVKLKDLAYLRQVLQHQVATQNKALEIANTNLKKEILEKNQAQQQLRETNAKLDSIINNSEAIITLKTLQGRYDLANEFFRQNLLLATADIVGKTDADLFSESFATVITNNDARVLKEGKALQFEEVMPTKDGEHTFLSVKFPLFDHANQPYCICSICSDISDRIAAQNEILHLAQYDALTNLPNRSLFIDRTTQALARAQWEHGFVGILFIDLDRFKLVNDSLGHEVGDELLKEVAKRLLSNLRNGDSAARFGGDEFAILLRNVVSESDIVRVTEKIRASIASPYQIFGRKLVITPSIGVSRSPVNGIDANSLIKKADAAMYKAKRIQKNCYYFYTPDDENKASELLALELDLRSALHNEQLRLVYQPLVNVSNGKVNEYEALLRWQHPSKGAISPAIFIPILEETGMIIDVGNWVIEEACKFAAGYAGKGDNFKVSINLSSNQFAQDNLVKKLREVLTATRCNPHWLELELTESVLVDDVERAGNILNDLAAMGVSLAIDDFGTGYSSMNSLKQLPFNKLKIDRSFIVDATSNSKDKAIVTTIVQLANNLGMSIVAEGVETEQQYSLLTSIFSDHTQSQIQGYIFSKPLELEHINADENHWVRQWRQLNAQL